MAKTGMDINLYLDSQGDLVVTTEERADLFALQQTRGIILDIPLDGVVTAKVEFIVSEVDVPVALSDAKFLIADQELTGKDIPGLRKFLKALRHLSEVAK